MNTIYAKYNMYHNSIDIYTSAGYMLRIDCNKAEDGLKSHSPLTVFVICTCCFPMGQWNQ